MNPKYQGTKSLKQLSLSSWMVRSIWLLWPCKVNQLNFQNSSLRTTSHFKKQSKRNRLSLTILNCLVNRDKTWICHSTCRTWISTCWTYWFPKGWNMSTQKNASSNQIKKLLIWTGRLSLISSQEPPFYKTLFCWNTCLRNLAMRILTQLTLTNILLFSCSSTVRRDKLRPNLNLREPENALICSLITEQKWKLLETLDLA